MTTTPLQKTLQGASFYRRILNFVLLVLLASGFTNAQTTLLSTGSSWSYLDNNTRPSNWETSGFNDASWSTGNLPAGYGTITGASIATTISYGPSSTSKYITTYFRKSFNNTGTFSSLDLSLLCDDGVVIYLNGTEVLRYNMPSGTPGQNTLASSTVSSSDEGDYTTYNVSSAALVSGTNVIAVELHQATVGSSDLGFDLGITGNVSSGSNTLISSGENWKYLDNNTRPTNWETSSFNDGSWSSGDLTAGYGTITGGTVTTTVSYGPSSTSKYITTYFRKTFNNTGTYTSLDLDLLCDDGAVVYLNGTEVMRYNMPTGTVGHSTLANSAVGGSDEGDFTTYSISSSALVSGTNVLAVEIHQATVSSTDLGFDLELTGVTSGGGGGGNMLLNAGASWNYLDNNTRPTNWETTSFNDGSWSSGNTPAGYGTIDGASLATTVSYGPSSSSKYTTTYFRTTFNATTTTYAGGLDFDLLHDDGVVIYLNGTEVVRTNMPSGTIGHNTYASSAIGGTAEGDYTTYNVSSSLLNVGTNTVAVEVHQANASSSDLGFDLSIEGQTTLNLSLRNGPYLQVATPTSINVRWRTAQSTDAKVFYGTSQGSLTSSATDASFGTEHEVSLSGLSPDTKYFYAIGTTNDDTIQSGPTNYFITPPTVGTEKETRIWVLGDCGIALNSQEQSKNQYYAYDGKYTDAVLLLGDNAYSNGTDSEYETKFFEYYDDKILRQSPLWPSPGNHDYAQSSARQDDKNVPYYDLFTLPTNGEAGGVASGTEAFYSFDLANIHFLSLDSYGEESDKRMSDTTGAQAQWVKQDLAATNQTWKIAYWHHPPYTMGSHNSDNEGELVDIRNEFIRMIEQYDVDLILTGHSHNYERTKLMHGHYGSESTYSSSSHDVSTSSGEYDGSANSCPYTKDSDNPVGTVYVVSGSAGRATHTQGAWPHDAMYTAYNIAGTFVIDVEGGRLSAKFLGYDGVVRDSFTMFKDVNQKSEYDVDAGDSIDLTSSWIGDYSWNSSSETTQTIRVDSDSATYIVTDSKGCLADTFIVSTTGTGGGPTCSDGIQNGNETGVDCGGPDCSPCPTCNDGIQNGNETGVDCGGPDCPACPTCSDGIQNGNETGVDCGGPDCSPCPTCNDGVQNGNETGVDCGGPDCPACPTCSDGIQNGSETGVDCGGPDCAPCITCNDGIQNGNETGVDCGGPDCPACPTCSDGIQNGNETGVDCGGPDCAPCVTCNDGIQNGNETGVDCGGPDCPACPTCSDGIQNGNETGVDCGGPDCSPCPTCNDGIQNGNETGVDCGGPDCPACPTCSDGIQNGNETGVDCGGPDCAACPTCSDGVQNGNETGVDCGGPDCSPCASGCTHTLIDFEDFESGWGIWNDGGSDARRSSNDDNYAIGTYCIRIRDNTSTSVMTTDNLNLSSYDDVEVKFTYYPRSMDNSNEDFWLQVSTDGGSTYTTVEEWNRGDEFENNIREYDSVTINGPFTTNTRFRFRCDASGNNDHIYIDEVEIEGCQNSSSFVEHNPPAPLHNSNLSGYDNQLNSIKFYPNPFGDLLSMEFENTLDRDYHYTVYDVQGKQVLTGDLISGNKNFKLDMKDLPIGVYLIRVNNGSDWSKASRIIKR